MQCCSKGRSVWSSPLSRPSLMWSWRDTGTQWGFVSCILSIWYIYSRVTLSLNKPSTALTNYKHYLYKIWRGGRQESFSFHWGERETIPLNSIICINDCAFTHGSSDKFSCLGGSCVHYHYLRAYKWGRQASGGRSLWLYKRKDLSQDRRLGFHWEDREKGCVLQDYRSVWTETSSQALFCSEFLS